MDGYSGRGLHPFVNKYVLVGEDRIGGRCSKMYLLFFVKIGLLDLPYFADDILCESDIL